MSNILGFPLSLHHAIKTEAIALVPEPRIEKVAIIGAGAMGRQIAGACVDAGLDVVVVARTAASVARAIDLFFQEARPPVIEHDRLSPLERQFIYGSGEGRPRGILAGNRPAPGRVAWTRHLVDVAGCDFVLESIIEDRDAKRELLKALENVVGPTVPIGTNTSSITIEEIAHGMRHPERVVGTHFVNPVYFEDIAELAANRFTSPAAIVAAAKFLKILGKEPIPVTDAPGFVLNRILFASIREAIHCFAEGVASAEAIDELGSVGRRMGPLRLADYVGLDVVLEILKNLDEEGRAPDVLADMIGQGRLGRKSGAGFFEYRE